MENFVVVLKEIVPNDARCGGTFRYNGKDLVLITSDEYPVKIDGWVFSVRSYGFGILRPKIFLLNQRLQLEIAGEVYPIDGAGFSFKVRKYPFFRRLDIAFETKRMARYLFFVHPIKFLENDGMDPASVEPFTGMLSHVLGCHWNEGIRHDLISGIYTDNNIY